MRNGLRQRVEVLEDQVRVLMGAKEDLAQAVADLQAEETAFEAAVTSALNDLKTQVANLSAAGVDTASVEAAVSAVEAVVASEKAAQATAAADDPGPTA
jgi:hypothetical protein